VATRHLRRSAVRLLYRLARRHGLADHDPSLDLDLPPRSSLPTRPLTDDEIHLCRSFSLSTLTESRQPAAWALAEATASSSEIPRILVSDLDLEKRLVWIHGGSKTVPRWGCLTEWGQRQLLRRLQSLRQAKEDDSRLVYSGRGSAQSRQASSCAAISEVLRRAGLHQEPDVRPGSVAAWEGANAFRDGAHIDEVARKLGVRSLDRAAQLIGWDWAQGPEG
jgi:integrase/recombinase XerC